MKQIRISNDENLAALGLGTWHLGDDRSARSEEIATLRLGLELGATVIDTAEMYGDGRAEELVGEAIAGIRDKAFVVSKVLPNHASRAGTIAACERSLHRLQTDRIDLYLLHWRGAVPFAETMDAFSQLRRDGKIRFYGVSNLDLADLRELWETEGGSGIATDQLLYNLTRRGIEWDLLPWLRKRRIPVMAYSPIEQGRLLTNPQLKRFAESHRLTPARVALAWLLSNDDILVIPKTGNRARVRENLKAADLQLSASQLAELNQIFPPPSGPAPLEML